MKKITLLTSLKMDDFIHDDHLLVSELESRGFSVQCKPWETLQDEGEDLFIIRTTWNYTDHFEEFISCLEDIKDRLWNPLPIIKWNANKKYLLDLYNKGLDVMPLYLASGKASLEKALLHLDGDDFVAKPIFGAGAKGLIRFNSSNLPNLSSEMLIQKFYPEITQGEVSLVFYDNQYAYAVKKTPQPGEIRVQEEFGGKITAYTPSDDELKLAHSVLEHLPAKSLYARVDIVPKVGLIELECIEPSLFFGSNTHGAKLFVDAITKFLEEIK